MIKTGLQKLTFRPEVVKFKLIISTFKRVEF